MILLSTKKIYKKSIDVDPEAVRTQAGDLHTIRAGLWRSLVGYRQMCSIVTDYIDTIQEEENNTAVLEQRHPEDLTDSVITYLRDYGPHTEFLSSDLAGATTPAGRKRFKGAYNFFIDVKDKIFNPTDASNKLPDIAELGGTMIIKVPRNILASLRQRASSDVSYMYVDNIGYARVLPDTERHRLSIKGHDLPNFVILIDSGISGATSIYAKLSTEYATATAVMEDLKRSQHLHQGGGAQNITNMINQQQIVLDRLRHYYDSILEEFTVVHEVTHFLQDLWAGSVNTITGYKQTEKGKIVALPTQNRDIVHTSEMENQANYAGINAALLEYEGVRPRDVGVAMKTLVQMDMVAGGPSPTKSTSISKLPKMYSSVYHTAIQRNLGIIEEYGKYVDSNILWTDINNLRSNIEKVSTIIDTNFSGYIEDVSPPYYEYFDPESRKLSVRDAIRCWRLSSDENAVFGLWVNFFGEVVWVYSTYLVNQPDTLLIREVRDYIRQIEEECRQQEDYQE